jgi:hypothetical protein
MPAFSLFRELVRLGSLTFEDSMRIVGSFKVIYEQARHLNNIEHTPDLVVRLKKDGNWVIEPRTEPCGEIVLEVGLKEFWNYFYCCFDHMMTNQNYVVSKQDILDYVRYVEDIREMGLC